jgi:hypothetical protein
MLTSTNKNYTVRPTAYSQQAEGNNFQQACLTNSISFEKYIIIMSNMHGDRTVYSRMKHVTEVTECHQAKLFQYTFMFEDGYI